MSAAPSTKLGLVRARHINVPSNARNASENAQPINSPYPHFVSLANSLHQRGSDLESLLLDWWVLLSEPHLLHIHRGLVHREVADSPGGVSLIDEGGNSHWL